MIRDAIMPQSGVVTLTGYGIRIAVQRGHLLVEDGPPRARRQALLARVGSGLSRLLVLGQAGTVTLEALRWLQAIGAAFVHIDPAGDVIAVGAAAAVRDSRVRRGQASASTNGAGLAVARQLLGGKVEAQAVVVERIPGRETTAVELRHQVALIESAESLGRAQYVESRAAAAYWDAWRDVPVRFAGMDAKRVPAHWRTFGTRSSPLSASPRKAANPANSLLNYLYSLLEAEARLALIAVGCDLGLSVIHAEQPYRDSFALDLMEPVRPHVDSLVLDLLAERQFSRADFFEGRDGCCRLMPSITRPLAATCREWATLLAPVAEHVADVFARAPKQVAASLGLPHQSAAAAKPLRTPLTGRNRSRRVLGKIVRDATELRRPSSYFLPQCKLCGVQLGARSRTLCDLCAVAAPIMASTKSLEVTRRRKAAGIADGRASEGARRKKRAAAAIRTAERKAWESTRETVPGSAVYFREIAPGLAAVSAKAIAAATGLSLSAGNAIRRGAYVPHPRHWASLGRVIANPRRVEGWESLDSSYFATAVKPHIPELSIDQIRAATGLSLSYSRRVRAGHHVPHRRHWRALARAASLTARKPRS